MNIWWFWSLSICITLYCSGLILFNLWIQLPFSDRWKLLEDEIIRPRIYERKQFETGLKGNPSYRYDLELFSVPKSRWIILFILLQYDVQWITINSSLIFGFYQVRRKDFWLLSTVKKLLKEFIPALSHESDGLIFQVGWSCRFWLWYVMVVVHGNWNVEMLYPISHPRKS